jgi:hypothetical protein
MNNFSFSMKSGREKTVAFSSWHGGHHCAPQYRKTGLSAACAAANADSTLPLYQAMLAGAAAVALLDDVALVDDIELADDTAPDAEAGGALCFEHPATIKHNANARV